MNLTKMYMFFFAIITAVIGSTENRLADTCWVVSWNNGDLIGIEEIDFNGHLSNFSKLLKMAPSWAPAPSKLADYDGKTTTVKYDKHSLEKISRACEINDAVGDYDGDNKIVWKNSWWRFTTWTRVDCPKFQTTNHNNENRLIKAAEEEKAKDANAWTENSHEEIHESGGVDSNETNNPGDIKYESRQN